MKKGRRLLCIFLVVVLTSTLAVVLWPREREPVYQGKKLSVWLEAAVAGSSSEEARQAENAIRQIGTNALPCLVKWISYETPAWRKKVTERLTTLPGGFARKRITRRMFWDDRRQLLKQLAVNGFRCLGPVAAPAVPQLSRQLNLKGQHDEMTLMIALCHIGREGLAPLLSALTNQPPNLSVTMIPVAMLLAHQTGRDAGCAIPALLQCLNASDPNLRSLAASTLAELCSDPDNAAVIIPAVAQAAGAERKPIKFAGLKALGRFGVHAAVPLLIEYLDDPDPDVAECAFQSLTNLASQRVDAEHIVPALTNCLGRANGVRQTAALNALALYRGAARSAVPAIAPFQHDPEVRVRIAATNALQHIAPEMLQRNF